MVQLHTCNGVLNQAFALSVAVHKEVKTGQQVKACPAQETSAIIE